MHQFGSAGWLRMLESVLNDVARERRGDERGLRFTLCEVYKDAPAELDPVDGRISWHATFVPEGVTFSMGDWPEADIRIEGDYSIVAELGRIVVAGDLVSEQVFNDRVRSARRAGLISLRNSLGSQLAFLASVHDTMAQMTAPDTSRKG